MRRVFVVGTGAVLAMLAALAALPMAGLLIALANGYGARLPEAIVNTLVWLAMTDDLGRVTIAALGAATKILAVSCCMPVIVVALIGEAASLSGLAWYVGATAALSLLVPLSMAGTLANRASFGLDGLLLGVGALAGLIYWLVAGRSASPRRSAEVPV